MERTGLAGYLVATAYNLVRMANLLSCQEPRAFSPPILPGEQCVHKARRGLRAPVDHLLNRPTSPRNCPQSHENAVTVPTALTQNNHAERQALFSNSLLELPTLRSNHRAATMQRQAMPMVEPICLVTSLN